MQVHYTEAVFNAPYRRRRCTISAVTMHHQRGHSAPSGAADSRELHTVYAKTREEVEPMLEKMIGEVREKIRLERERERKKYTA